MTVDLSRLDAELESIPVDQVAVGRGMLAARQWAGEDLAAVDDALSSLSNGASVTAPAAKASGRGLDDLFEDDALDVGGEALAPPAEPANARSISSDLAAMLEGDDDDLDVQLGLSSPPPAAAAAVEVDEDETFDIDDELELIDDDDLLVVD